MTTTMEAPSRKRARTDCLPGYKMVERYCSEDEEEDMDMDMHSPTDASEDSVEVKVKPIVSLIGSCKSKRKCVEPRKFGEEVKRRIVDFQSTNEVEYGPFRPWSQDTPSGYVPAGYCPRENDQDEPLALVLREKTPQEKVAERLAPELRHCNNNAKCQPRPQDVVRLRGSHHDVTNTEELSNSLGRVQDSDSSSDKPRAFSVESLICVPGTSSTSAPASIVADKRKTTVPQQQRNYKNMTRERRIEANARERTRVHTISAAFDTLRRAVPAYSHNQKLSKLSVLRIACSYILTLSRVAGYDYSADNSQPSLADCVENVSRTIQLEGKLRKKKDD